jgi:hypothetical protein
VIGYRGRAHREGQFQKGAYRYLDKLDVYLCPNGQQLGYSTTNRDGYRVYLSDAKQCRQCPLRQQCTQSANTTKVITRHVWEGSRERIEQHRQSRIGNRIYRRRKETVERSFADAKQLHGHRQARMRGLGKVQQQCLLAATAQNIKKIAMLLSKKASQTPPSLLQPLLALYVEQLRLHQQMTSTFPHTP